MLAMNSSKFSYSSESINLKYGGSDIGCMFILTSDIARGLMDGSHTQKSETARFWVKSEAKLEWLKIIRKFLLFSWRRK
jgi:hypothetical protein